MTGNKTQIMLEEHAETEVQSQWTTKGQRSNVNACCV